MCWFIQICGCFIWVLYWLLLICLSIWVRYLPVLMLRVSATLYCCYWFLKGKFFIFDEMICFGECMISMIISTTMWYVMCQLLVTTNRGTLCLSFSQDLSVCHWYRDLDHLTLLTVRNSPGQISGYKNEKMKELKAVHCGNIPSTGE